MRYSYHTFGDIGLKIIDCLKYNDMHNMFKNKGVKSTDKQVVVEPKISNPLIHMVDVNMAITRSKVTKEHMFKDKKPIKKNLLLIGKKSKDYNKFLSRLYKRCKQKTHHEI